MAGWINTKVYDETGDAQKATGWFPFVFDTNGNGKLDEFSDKPEEGKDLRYNPGSGPYAVMPHPTDGSIWYTSGTFAGRPGFLRFDPKTKLSEFYELPKEAVGVRGGDIGKDGVLYGFGLGRPSDRLRPQQVQSPAERAERHRQSLPGGLHALPSIRARASTTCRAPARRRATTPGSTITTRSASATTCRSRPANLQDGFAALVNGKMVLLKVPYPMGYYAKGSRRPHRRSESRLEGQGLWSASGDRTPWLNERGKGAYPMAVHIQVRPDPLAH